MSATADLTPELNAPSIGDVHFEPSLEAFGYAELSVGNPFLSSIRFDTAEAKAGAKLEGSFASKTSQIADPAYKSDYKASVEASATLGTELEDVAKLLGLGEITGLGVEVSNDLANSPTGTLDADHKTFLTGDHVKFTANLSQTNFFPALGPYNVSKVVLVRNSGGNVTEVGSQNATSGQTQRVFNFTAPDSGNVDEFYAFVVTNLIPFDLFSLELARAVGHDTITVDVSPLASATLAPAPSSSSPRPSRTPPTPRSSPDCELRLDQCLRPLHRAVERGSTTVTATSQEDMTKSDSATVSLTSAGTVSILARSSSANVAIHGTGATDVHSIREQRHRHRRVQLQPRR